MSLHDYAKKHKMKDYDKSFKMYKHVKDELVSQIISKETPEKRNVEENCRTYKCHTCNFETKYNFNLIAHYKTLKHINNSNKLKEESLGPQKNMNGTNIATNETLEQKVESPASESRKRRALSGSNSPATTSITGNSILLANDLIKRPKLEHKIQPSTDTTGRAWYSGCEYNCQICGKMHYGLNELLFHVRRTHNMTGREKLVKLQYVSLALHCGKTFRNMYFMLLFFRKTLSETIFKV